MSDARNRSGKRDIQTHLQTNTLLTRRYASPTETLQLRAESLLDATHNDQCDIPCGTPLIPATGILNILSSPGIQRCFRGDGACFRHREFR